MKRFFLTVLCFLLMAGAMFWSQSTPAAEATDPIKELTVEKAKELAQEKTGKLSLNGLTALPAEVAKELSRHDGWLSLNGLTSLSNEAAEALGQHKGYLHLDGLTKISDEAAQGLSRHKGDLSLDGLAALPDEVARSLAKHSGGSLSLKGLKTLSDEAARALAQRKGGGPLCPMFLHGVTTLSVDSAAALAEIHPHNWDGRLPGIKTISDDVAKVLAKRQHGLSMEGLTTLSDESAKVLLPKLNGKQPALTSLSTEAAKALAQRKGGLIVLDGLTSLSTEAARALATADRAELSLNGLTTLSAEAAGAICKREGNLNLNGLTTISDEALKALAEHKAHPDLAKPVVYLKGLTKLSDEGAAVLASWPKWSGELPELPLLSEKAAKALATSANWDGKLPALKTLSGDLARALAQRRGNLSLNGLTTLSDETAAALAQHQGGTLSLNGLKNLSEKAAKALASRDGRLSLTGLTTLSNGAALALAQHKGDWLFLDGLTSLSDEVAKALAQHQGAVSLSGLQTLSHEGVRILKDNPKIGIAEKFRAMPVHAPVAADAKFVRTFLNSHCMSCHNADTKEGDFSMDKLTLDNIAGRVAYASILERLRAGDMPPSKKARPDPAVAAGVIQWIQAQLDTPLKGPVAYFPVKEKPVDGNRLPHAILFGGPRGPSVPSPPRLWRLSPTAYTKLLGEFKADGLQQPFGWIQERGFKDFSALYALDEGAASLLLTNAEQVVATQVKPHTLVNVKENPAATKEKLWPDEARAKTATLEEQKHLQNGWKVRQGGGVLAPLMHPKVAANRKELEAALRHQYMLAVARPPSTKEIESLVKLYNGVAQKSDYALAGKTILMAPLMAPEAVLRFEVGLGLEVRPGVRMLSPREIAFALSLALSNKREPGLLEAAAKGRLTTRAEVAALVQKILDDPKMDKSRVPWFFREYFDYHRATEVFKDPLPMYLQRKGIGHNPGGMVGATDTLVLHILGHDKDVLKELLTTSESFRSHELFDPNGTSLIFRHLPPSILADRPLNLGGTRIGILMQPSWLVAWSVGMDNDIVRRGRWVREKLLGGRVPDLPVDVQANVPDDPHLTLRERLMVTRAPACWKCHQRMDDLGLPFEDVDHYGRPRSAEQVLDLEAMKNSKGKNTKIYRDAPLDTTGFIAFSGDPKLDGPVKDAPEMLRKLAESARVRQVFIRHVFRYFLGRNETPGDALTLQEADRAYVESGGSFKALVVSLLSSESFLYRTVPTVVKGGSQ